MALLIHVGSHPDELVGKLCDMLASPPPDPFAPELVAVPTRGIERWLTQRIASGMADRTSGDGVCANVEFPSPRRLVRDVLLTIPELASALESWEGTALTCSVVSVLDDHLDEPWMWLLDRFVDAGRGIDALGNGQRLRAARKISGLFTRYARRRPDMVGAWRAGRDLGADGGALPEADLWQPRLWRLVRDRIGMPGLAELLPAALDPVRRGKVDLHLPDRLSVYGLTAADPVDLEVIEAVAARRDVHLYLLHPSAVLWQDTAALLDGSTAGAPPARVSDPTVHVPRHPFLRSWARESRELQMVLAGRNHTGGASPARHRAASTTVLGRLQRDIRSNTPPARAGTLVETRRGDRSVQIHVCYGARRQVEVLRDAILHVLAADSTLEPRDIVVMTPDLVTFAPLLEATFLRAVDLPGSGPPADHTDRPVVDDALPDLRLRIADRAPAATNPLVRFAATVLDLAGSRLEAGAVRELVAMPVVRQLFGFDEETADEISAVIEDTNVRWGLDGEHRALWSAGTGADHTWRRGLDRALAGVFYSDSSVRVVGTVAPLDGAEGQEARPIGILAQILDRIVAVRALLGEPKPHSAWGPAIAGAVRLLAAPGWDDQWQWGQLERLLEESFPSEGTGPDDPLIGAAEARIVVGDWTRDAPSPLHFRTGDITVCTLVPMRSVPYRVVCLLGMDDHRFPRSSRVDGDDLLVDNEMIGDSDRGAEDRQLLLDAVMAAGDYLIVTYSGRDELTNAEYPPAVPIAELRDVLADMVGRAGLGRLETRHPLQPFSETNFVAGERGVDGPWGFDPMQFDGALAIQRRQIAELPRLSIPPPEEDFFSQIRLDDLRSFIEHPARTFLRKRLGFVIPPRGEIPDDTVPTALDPLSEWKVTNRLLSGLLAGHSIESLEAHERAADTVPPANLGLPGLERARQRATDLWQAARTVGYEPGRYQQHSGVVRVGNRMVEGTVGADPGTGRIDVVTPSRLKGKQRLRAFLQMVFLTALDPHRPWQGLLLGRHLRGDKLWSVRIGPIRGEAERRRREAERLLSGLVDLYVEGLTTPIPLPCETSFVWQRKIGSHRDVARKVAGQAWETDRFSPEAKDPANQFLFPDLGTISALERTSFPAHARSLWGPILPLLVEKSL
ncbi:MAG: exodeoxyribonuclease V subunit gamma [bacterium]|nr:exodeoxyribonuclease V subunit gamma [bacterium]MDE0437634.1 exodeoxyribonuclease V subunit gamma [bacterium]